MNEDILREQDETLKSFLSIYEQVAEYFDKMIGFEIKEIKLNDIFHLNLCDFLLALSISDFSISHSEIEFINKYFEYDFTEKTACDYIIENNISINELLKTTPRSLSAIIELENALNEQMETNVFSQKLVDCFTAFGAAFAQCSEQYDKTLYDCHTYINMLRQYINLNPIETELSPRLDESLPKSHRKYRDYSLCCEKTQRLMKKADNLFDTGRYSDAGYAYIEADGCNSENDVCRLYEAVLGDLRSEIYEDAQTQYFPAEQGYNMVQYKRECININRTYMTQIAELSGDNFELEAAQEYIDNMIRYYENAYVAYLEKRKQSRGFFASLFR